MTENANPVMASSEVPDHSDQRLERVLDAAADLLVRWGYQRVTVDDVARQAGVGKGTVYLHFRTKEALFLTVLLRVQRRVVSAMVRRMREDPAEVLPARMMRSMYLALAEDPVTRQTYLGDGEILGKLAREAAATLGELGRRRDEVVRTHLDVLREVGALRRDIGTDAQRYLLGAISTGFYFVERLDLSAAPSEPTAAADLLEHALASAMQAPGPVVPDRRLAHEIADRYESLITHIDDEWRLRTR